MAFDVKTRRRWLGILFLCSALLMLLAGETVLKDHLHDLAFLIYWMSCFGFTGLAVLTALWDAKENQRHLRQERRNLLENTLNDIQIAAKKRQHPGKQAPK